MAKVILVGLEPSLADQLGPLLADDGHDVYVPSPQAALMEALSTDIVFAGGSGKQYISLLREVRMQRPSLPFIIVTQSPDNLDWLDALEAGATDYCAAPFELRHLKLIMEAALSKTRTFAA